MYDARHRDWLIPGVFSVVCFWGVIILAYGWRGDFLIGLSFVILLVIGSMFLIVAIGNYIELVKQREAFHRQLMAESQAVTWQSHLAHELTVLARTNPDLAATMRLYMRPEWVLEVARTQAPRRITLAGTRVNLVFIEYCFDHSTDKTWLAERNHFGDGTYKFDDHHEVTDRDQYRELTGWLERNGYIQLVREGRPYEWRHPWTINLVREAFFGAVSEKDIPHLED